MSDQLRAKLWAGFGAWALLGLPVILVFAVGVWFLLWVSRLVLLGIALTLTVVQLLTTRLRSRGSGPTV